MRCPKCSCILSETNRVCPRCGEDLSLLAETLGPFYKASGKEVILKDTLITAPPFISEPVSPEIELPELESSVEEKPTVKEKDAVEEKPVVSERTLEAALETPHPAKSVEEEIFQELEEALEEEEKA